jgi:hypothetical protein
MAVRLSTQRAEDLGKFAQLKAAGGVRPFTPQPLAHIYVKLDFKPQFENAANADDAKGFLRSIYRAAAAAHGIAEQYGGMLLEAQGSTLHIGLPHAHANVESTTAGAFVGDLHLAYRLIFDNPKSRVDGWRMAIDAGKTLIVAGQGVHGDDSWVSLGKSANRPAKHLYAQLELSEDKRSLKRFFVAARNPATGQWHHQPLDRFPSRLVRTKSIAEDARRADPRFDFVEAASGWKRVQARAYPLAPAGSPGSPSPEKPRVHFGWVLRSDLDGFTARVEECFDNDLKLQELAAQFYGIMETAAKFTDRHKESLVQLPWAGDNYTAAAVFTAKPEYDRAAPKRLVELALDFEKEMRAEAEDKGFGGWAHGVAGGVVHGNAAGNVYLAGVEVSQRRFLVGVGEGFGRSTQAFGDIDPKAKELVIYKPDWERLDQSYKKVFEPAVTYRGEQSSLYYKAKCDPLLGVRARQSSMGAPTIITYPSGSQSVPTKPHYR